MNSKYPLALPDGSVLSGQYIIYKVLGQGGFGITYEAQDHKTGGKVAIKEFFPDSLATRHQGETTVMPFTGERGDNFAYGKECFLQEAETLGRFIGTPGIVRIYSYFEENGTAYFVMDFIDGISLDEYIKQNGGKLGFEETNRILRPVMEALEAVHSQGVIHRDIAPDNIYITNNGQIKLIDFGAARQSLGDKSQSLDVVLKHGFAPKEQYSRRGKQGPYTDVYALGATYYFALTGSRPVDSIDRMDEDELVPPSKLGVDLPPEAEAAIMKALNVRPSERFQSMSDFKDAMPLQQPDDPKAEETEESPSENLPESTSQPQTAADSAPAYTESAVSSNETGKSTSDDNVHVTGSGYEEKQDTVTNKTKHIINKEYIIAAILIIATIVIIIGIIISSASYSSNSAPAAAPKEEATDFTTDTSTTTAEAGTEEEEEQNSEPAAADLEEEEGSEKASETISEEPTEAVVTEPELELYPVILGNRPDNLLNLTSDYDRNGHMAVLENEHNLISVSLIDDWIYGLEFYDGGYHAVKYRERQCDEIPELKKLGEIFVLLVSEEYYFTINKEFILCCISRENGELIGEREIDSADHITFTDDGKMCFIDGEAGSQYVSAVPAGDIGNKNPEKILDLPAGIRWTHLCFDGTDFFTIGEEINPYGIDNIYHFCMNGRDDAKLSPDEIKELNAASKALYFPKANANNRVLYLIWEDEDSYYLNCVDFNKRIYKKIREGTRKSSIRGPWICDDGDVSMIVDGEMVKVPTSGSNT